MKEYIDGCPALASLRTDPHTHLCVPPLKTGIWEKEEEEKREGWERRNVNLLVEEKEDAAEKGTGEEAYRPSLC